MSDFIWLVGFLLKLSAFGNHSLLIGLHVVRYDMPVSYVAFYKTLLLLLFGVCLCVCFRNYSRVKESCYIHLFITGFLNHKCLMKPFRIKGALNSIVQLYSDFIRQYIL